MDIPSLILLGRVSGVGSRRLRILIDHFRDPLAALHCSARELTQVPEIDEPTRRAILRAGLRPSEEARRTIEEQLARLSAMGGTVLTLWDHAYPPRLAAIHDAPPLLYVRGDIPATHHSWMLAIVGTRHPSPYGAYWAREFSLWLGNAGFTVVSGLARGIDTLAHQAALDAGSHTIGILGSGIDVIYPPENAPLAERIIEHGAIISEFEMGSRPHAAHFPQRNRIISGMCIGTLVIETGRRGGAMITASMALEQNREVFAVPASLDARTMNGTNLLIKRGEALLVERPQELLEVLQPLLEARASGHLPVHPSDRAHPPSRPLTSTRSPHKV